MLEFKKWLKNEDFSEYDPPDEGHMDQIRKVPLTIDLVPNLHGDLYRCRMPIGSVEEFLINKSSMIGLNKSRGSLNSACFRLLEKREFKELYRLLQYVQFNNNKTIRAQLISHRAY